MNPDVDADSESGVETPPETQPAIPDRYGQALEELEDLLEDMEDADIDVDHLAERVARGVELVRFCRERLAVVTADVDQVVGDLVSDQIDDSGSNNTGNNTASGGKSETADD